MKLLTHRWIDTYKKIDIIYILSKNNLDNLINYLINYEPRSINGLIWCI
jgi:hypothetical protein